MRYWWVNQNQTFHQEIAGGYLWSPKRNANGARNPFYESMREVSPGDLIFSFVDTRIAAIGIARSYCWESPKPAEFGSVGQHWENVGWRVNVSFTKLLRKIRPKDHIDVLKRVLPTRYAPLQANGNGIQSIYLTELSSSFAEVLAGLIGDEAGLLMKTLEVGVPVENGRIVIGDDLDVWERRLEEQIETDSSIKETAREATVRDALLPRCRPSLPSSRARAHSGFLGHFSVFWKSGVAQFFGGVSEIQRTGQRDSVENDRIGRSANRASSAVPIQCWS